MATKHEIILEVQTSNARAVALTSVLPESLEYKYVSNDISLAVATLAENMDALHVLRTIYGKYEISGYWLSGFRDSRTLTISYKFPDFRVAGEPTLYAFVECSDFSLALEVVGKGNCKVVEVEEPAHISTRISCELES